MSQLHTEVCSLLSPPTLPLVRPYLRSSRPFLSSFQIFKASGTFLTRSGRDHCLPERIILLPNQKAEYFIRQQPADDSALNLNWRCVFTSYFTTLTVNAELTFSDSQKCKYCIHCRASQFKVECKHIHVGHKPQRLLRYTCHNTNSCSEDIRVESHQENQLSWSRFITDSFSAS